MAKQSSARKVARAARTGGGRTARGRASATWYIALTVIVVAGVFLVWYSRDERLDALGGPETEAPSTKDHWHVAYGVYVCDKFLPPAQDQKDPKGIHSHADGIIHVHPFGRSAAGKNATLGVFVDAIDGKLSEDSFDWPDEARHSNGDKCGDKEGKVKVWFNGTLHEGNARNLHLSADRGELVLAFVPDDMTLEAIGKPPSVPNLDQLTDLPATTNPNPAAQENQGTAGTAPPPPPSGAPPSSDPAPSVSVAESTPASSTP
jgi:hypothetical protein